MNKVQNLQGFRDFLPTEKRQRDFVVKKVTEVFERFGFEPLETPTLEYASLLLGKYGKEADKLVYQFEDQGGRKVALRYDQTVPTARVLAQYQNIIPKFFRRYQIQNVFRADKPQKGRFREFTQCDIDIFGTNSPLSDAEIVATTYFVFKNVGYPQVLLKINDRKILFDNLEKFATNNVDVFSIIQSIDKLDKLEEKQVYAELVAKGLTSTSTKQLMETIKIAQITPNLREIINFSEQLGVPKKSLLFTPTLARGLDYYTGMIFEVLVPEYRNNSLGGGGRYDNLISQLGGINMPAVGIAFGFDRMVEAALKLNLIPKDIVDTQVLVTVFNKDLLDPSLELIQNLRKNNINSEIYINPEDRLDKQLKYADKKQIPYVVIIGPDEVKQNKVTLKNMQTRESKLLNISELIDELKTK